MIKLMSPKIKRFAIREEGTLGIYLDFSDDDIGMWSVQEDMTENKLMDNLHKGCKANRSFSYKLYFPGDLIDT